MKKQSKPKVLVAMSGGVDSSVAALLLLKQGYEVTGAYMRQWSDDRVQSSKFRVQSVCTWKQDRRDALRVAAHLGIPLLTLDFEKEYKEWVMNYMFDEYKKGRTPNPDVLCNKYIKFGVWLDEARRRGFDFLATGHYAKIERLKDLKIKLIEAKDKNKDQTYFLHQLNQEQLKHTLFPIGHLTKPQVRKIAKKAGLPTAERAESMGICFVGEVPMKEFLKDKIKTKIGKIVMSNGVVIGEHEGLAFYTIGQRHGLIRHPEPHAKDPLANARRTGGSSRRPVGRVQNDGRQALFVVDKITKTNELVVGYENDPLLHKKEVMLDDVHWVSGQEPEFPLECKVRLRHRQPLQKSEIINHKSEITVRFKTSQKAVTPGQFAVFYKNGACLGGGVIA